jgi:hypothetical protein
MANSLRKNRQWYPGLWYQFVVRHNFDVAAYFPGGSLIRRLAQGNAFSIQDLDLF